MEISVQEKRSIPFLLFFDVFDANDQKRIAEEIAFIGLENLQPPERTSSATSEQKEVLKQNSGIFLDTCYKERHLSRYLRLYGKVITALKEDRQALVNNHLLLDSFFETNTDVTLLSYYGEGDYYKAHRDNSVWTMIYWMHEEPKPWEGGELVLEQLDFEIEPRNNCAVLFPSFLIHSVNKISSKKNLSKGQGRFSFTTFFNIKDV